LAATPDVIQAGIQKNSQKYIATAGGTTAYTATLVPAITAYADGMEFDLKINATNTGSSTINFNGLGALTFKKNTSQNVAAGDLVANDIVKIVVQGSGTTALILSTTSPYNFLTTKGDIPVASAANTLARLPVGADGYVPIADSSQATGYRTGPPSGLLYLTTTDVTITTSNEQTLISTTIPAGSNLKT